MKYACIGLGVVFLLLVQGCAYLEQDGLSSVFKSDDAAVPGLAPEDRLRDVLRLLEEGEVAYARSELVEYLNDRPESEIGLDLLRQIDEPALDYFPGDYRKVTLSSGESLSTLSRDYLGSPLQFYALAKYNGIGKPRDIQVRQTIRIPLTEKAVQAFAYRDRQQPATPVPPLPEKEPETPLVGGKPAPIDIGNELTDIENMYRQALNAYHAQDLNRAIALLDQVLAMDPDYENASLYRSEAIELKRKLTLIN